MAEFSSMRVATSIMPLAGLEKMMTRRHPMRNLILSNNLGLKKHKSSGAIMRLTRAGESNPSGKAWSRLLGWKAFSVRLLLWRAPYPKWTLPNLDLLYLPDICRIEHFVIAIAIMLAWWILCLLILFIYRFYSKNVRKFMLPHNSEAKSIQTGSDHVLSGDVTEHV